MIRLKRLVLDGVRNIGHGTLDFDDLPSGGSMTGIYGQNGSGKTTVVDAIDVLRTLLSGTPLPATAGDIVSVSAGEATITAVLLVETDDADTYLEYKAALRRTSPGATGARVTAETIRIGDAITRLGREAIGHRVTADGGGFTSTPAYAWRSVNAIPMLRETIARTEDRTYMEGRSFLFSRCATLDDEPDTEFLLDRIVAVAAGTGGMSAKSRDYITARFGLFARLRSLLHDYATNDVFVSTTRRGAYASYAYIPIMQDRPDGGTTEFLFDLLQPNPLTMGQADRLERVIGSFDRILPTLIPGLHISMKTRIAPSSDKGEDRVTAEILSHRGPNVIPFRSESEGIIRITALLGCLKHAYNDPNALVAIDEIDSGVFEYLLGDMLNQLADGCVGQLIFTAHNLRALEVLPDECIRTTLTDPDDRFTTLPRRSASNNQRRRYLTASEMGWDGPDIYDAPIPHMFANSLYAAGHPDLDAGIDEELARLNGSMEADRG